MFNLDTFCYKKAIDVKDEVNLILTNLDPALIVNNIQITQIKVQAWLEACNLDILIKALDKRMSNMKYSLGLVSSVVS